MNKSVRVYFRLFTLVMILYAVESMANGYGGASGRNAVGDSSKLSGLIISNNILYICSYNTDSRSTAETLEPFVRRCNEIDSSRQVIIESMECTGLKDLFSLKARMKKILGKYIVHDRCPALVVLIGREAVSTYLSLDEPIFKKMPIGLTSAEL